LPPPAAAAAAAGAAGTRARPSVVQSASNATRGPTDAMARVCTQRGYRHPGEDTPGRQSAHDRRRPSSPDGAPAETNS
jgi:hypothetical protein